ncbi:VPA1267 family protein [Paraburkholderia sediminicola]|uniref:VPA1267 family protein n=1 Tax=Paraburkholderia sediminicola TaxID=458836 RepID=UPI0038B84A61
MASGRQIADENFRSFQTWLASKADSDFRQMVSRGVLSRKEIAKECGFAKSALDQNPRIKAALRATEDGLRERGILPAPLERGGGELEMPLVRETGMQRAVLESERLKRLEQDNASLRAENAELKRQLVRYAALQDALSLTGRIPR